MLGKEEFMIVLQDICAREVSRNLWSQASWTLGEEGRSSVMNGGETFGWRLIRMRVNSPLRRNGDLVVVVSLESNVTALT